MGDFQLDLRPSPERQAVKRADAFRFHPRTQIWHFEEPEFQAIVTVNQDPPLWAPYVRPDGQGFVALAGRVALDDQSWAKGRAIPGEGGTACKAIDAIYRSSGPAGLESLSGNFTILVYNRAERSLLMLTDCSGVFPAFEASTAKGSTFGSHPDALASLAGEHDRLDDISIAEFLITGTISHPFTYYRNIRAVPRASFITFSFPSEAPYTIDRRCYFPLEFQGSSADRESNLAEELAQAFRSSVARRTRADLGRTAIALSGGLDSRAVLASLHPSADAFAFTCFDSENLELRAAKAIAAAANVTFLPYKRSLEYYGDSAVSGIRIGAGMGSFANNHFLGALPWIHEQGAKTLLTGCYCDYLFKALPLNRHTHPVTGLEELAPFKPEFYFSHHWPDTPRAREVRDRIASRYPEALIRGTGDREVFQLEVLRTFPLCYEGDNAQRVVPQRLTGWFPPVSDPDLLKVYQRIPYRWKLNRSIFSRAVRIICGTRFDPIPDANTGAAVGARWWSTAAHATLLRLKARLSKFRPTLGTQGSWPNWPFYTKQSRTLQALLAQDSPAAIAFAEATLGVGHIPRDFQSCSESQMWLLLRVLNLKLWHRHRI